MSFIEEISLLLKGGQQYFSVFGRSGWHRRPNTRIWGPLDSWSNGRCRPCVVKLKLDLHEIYDRGDDIDRALRGIIEEAIEKRVRLVEIIPGKGTGQLKKRVLRFLDQKDIKVLYDRVEKDSHNFGRVFVHFRPK